MVSGSGGRYEPQLHVLYIYKGSRADLSRIYYTGNTAGLTAKNSVRFYLEGTSDVHVSYATKSEVKTAYRLKTIRMIGNISISKVYGLEYDELDYASNITQVKLKEVTQYGSDVALSENGEIVSGTSRKMADCSYYLPVKGFDKVNRSLELEYNEALVRVQGDFDGNGLTDFMSAIPGEQRLAPLN